MSDRAYEIATRLWERLSHEPDPRSERTVNPIAEALRDYAEEARRDRRVESLTPDSLEAALRAVPLTQIATCVSGCHTEDGEPDYPALAAAVREWIKGQMPPKDTGHAGTFAYADAYNECLADVARRLGLS